MIFIDLVSECRALKLHEERTVTDDYYEAVFYNHDMKEVNEIISARLGPPVKTEDAAPTEKNLELTKNNGGIRVGQTLYIRDSEDTTLFAMFWPWQDKIHTTVKLVLLTATEF
jgi:hypothetical protein